MKLPHAHKLFSFISTVIALLGLLCISLTYPHALHAAQSPRLAQGFTQSPDTAKRIVISLSTESLTAYDGDVVYLTTSVTTGGPYMQTPTGTYHVISKWQNFVMHSPWPSSDWRWYPDSFVNYGLLYAWGGYFIHDASWRSNFGPGSNVQSGKPGEAYTGTHGCTNVPLAAEQSLFYWAPIGTTVIVQY